MQSVRYHSYAERGNKTNPKVVVPHVFSGNKQAVQMDSRLQPAGMIGGVFLNYCTVKMMVKLIVGLSGGVVGVMVTK